MPFDKFGSPYKFRKDKHSRAPTPRSDCYSSEESLALSGMEELENLQRSQEHYENLLAEQYAHLTDADANLETELPKLEELGNDQSMSSSSSSADELGVESEFLFRAPYVMLPFNDQMLYVPGSSPITVIDEDKNFDDGSFEELASRAPFIPPPNDDTILTFDDLPNSPLPFMSDYGNIDVLSKMPELYLEEELFDGKMLTVGPAVVPHTLVGRKYAKNVTEPAQLAEGGAGAGGKCIPLLAKKSKPILPWISTTEAEFNAPTGSLLHGFELLSALEKITAS